MEWGNGNSAFMAEAAYQLLFKNPLSLGDLLHPLVLTGLAGQILLGYAALSKLPRKLPAAIGILSLSIMVLIILLAGMLAMNIKMILSTLPFIGLSIFYFVRVNRTHTGKGLTLTDADRQPKA
jgi:hypothetical protein